MKSLRPVAPLVFLALAVGCGDAPPASEPTDGASAENAAPAVLPAPDGASVIEVTAAGPHEFRLSTSEVPAGWTTFRFTNASPAVHFALVEKLPDGITIEDYERDVAPAFQEGMNLLNAGEPDAAMEAFGGLPEWYGGVVFMGGPGLLSTGGTALATVELDPGTYLVECYVKTADGEFHSYLGMVEQFVVTEARSDAPEPEATLRLSISREGGIGTGAGPGEVVAPGVHTITVHFEDQAPHENFVGHDVHLARLDDDTDLETLAGWMDWTQPTGLQEPAPVEFVGGIGEMPAGSTGYMTLELTPGEYVWIAEVPDPAGKGMLKTFTVAEGDGDGDGAAGGR